MIYFLLYGLSVQSLTKTFFLTTPRSFYHFALCGELCWQSFSVLFFSGCFSFQTKLVWRSTQPEENAPFSHLTFAYRTLIFFFTVKVIDLFSYYAGKELFPYYFWVTGYFVDTFELDQRGHYEVKTVSVDQWPTVTVISVLMQFLRNQTVWNCRTLNVEAQLRVCVYQSARTRCAGLEPQTGISLHFYYVWLVSQKITTQEQLWILPGNLLHFFSINILFTLQVR